VLLNYERGFRDIASLPQAFVVRAPVAEVIKRPWLGGAYAIYYNHRELQVDMEPHKNAWNLFDDPDAGWELLKRRKAV
jgi:hypothetical protein